MIDERNPDAWSFVWGADRYRPRDFYDFCYREVVPPNYLAEIWETKCTMKHRVFAWLMLVDRLNTRDMLQRRNYNIGSDFTCMTCTVGARETRNHLFLVLRWSAGIS